MESFRIKDIIEATNGKLIKGEPEASVSGISTDSRTLKYGDFFVALIGDRFDGHNFIPQSISHGAAGIIVSRTQIQDEYYELSSRIKNVIMVQDTTIALGDIASYYRRKFEIPVIGVTGSNGKTTTKDMAALVLSKKYTVLRNEGNLNNTIGLPLTLFNLSSCHKAAILEMGISLPGEMSRLVEIAQPDVAIVTNISSTHLEFLGSVKGVAEEKGILVKSSKAAVLNFDDPLVAGMVSDYSGRIISYGIDSRADVTASDIAIGSDGKPEFTLMAKEMVVRVKLPSLGRHNIYNALAAASAGVLFCVDIKDIKEAFESHQHTYMRMQRIDANGITIVDDTYNSNPTSLKAAVDFLSNAGSDGRKILVAGDMLELGDKSNELHISTGRYIARLRGSEKGFLLITVGERSRWLAEGAIEAGIEKSHVIIFRTNMEAANHLRSIIVKGDFILVKGSRGMKMEEIVKEIQK